MTEKQRKDNLKETIKEKISTMVGCKELTTKTISSANLKNIKSWLSSKEYSLEDYLFCLDFITRQYYTWEVELKDINPIDNCGRLIYLVNDNIEVCHILLMKENTVNISEDKIKLKSAKDIEDYHTIAEKVGL